MKFLAAILSIYVLVLTLLPCVDVPTDNLLHKTELTKASTEKHTDDGDHCSPFCTCQCCASPMVSHFQMFNFQTATILEQRIFSYHNLDYTSPFYSIWQPPKLG